MEIIGVIDILKFSWIYISSQVSEVFLGIFGCTLGGVSIFQRVVETFFEFLVNGGSSCLGKTLSI